MTVGAFFMYNNANKQKSDAYEAAAANQEIGIAAEAFEEKLSAYSLAIDGFTAMMVGIGAWDAFRHESYADFDYFKVVSQDSRGEHFDGLK